MKTNVYNAVFSDEINMQNVGRAFRNSMMMAMALSEAAYGAVMEDNADYNNVEKALRRQESVAILLDNALKYKAIIEFLSKAQDN